MRWTVSFVILAGCFDSLGVNDHASMHHGANKIAIGVGSISLSLSQYFGLMDTTQRKKAIIKFVAIQSIVIPQNISSCTTALGYKYDIERVSNQHMDQHRIELSKMAC